MIRAGVIGVGYWGPNLLRNLVENENVQVTRVCDLSSRLTGKMARRYPTLQPTSDYNYLVKDPAIDLITIATPVHTHFELALSALSEGKHVWITKPMALNVAQCRKMIAAAEKHKKVLMVDHTFAYHPAVTSMREMVTKKELGDLLYFQSTRMNLGLYQPDVSVIYDLMAHDLSILNEIVKEDPIELSVTSKQAAGLPQPDIAYLQLNYQSGFIASVQASWLCPLKIRQTILTGSKKMVLYDDNDVLQKVKVFDKGVSTGDYSLTEENYTKFIQYRQGEINSPALATTEALKTEVEHLVDCISHNRRPRTDGHEGLRVVRLLERADEIARANRSWVPIES